MTQHAGLRVKWLAYSKTSGIINKKSIICTLPWRFTVTEFHCSITTRAGISQNFKKFCTGIKIKDNRLSTCPVLFVRLFDALLKWKLMSKYLKQTIFLSFPIFVFCWLDSFVLWLRWTQTQKDWLCRLIFLGLPNWELAAI